MVSIVPLMDRKHRLPRPPGEAVDRQAGLPAEVDTSIRAPSRPKPVATCADDPLHGVGHAADFHRASRFSRPRPGAPERGETAIAGETPWRKVIAPTRSDRSVPTRTTTRTPAHDGRRPARVLCLARWDGVGSSTFWWLTAIMAVDRQFAKSISHHINQIGPSAGRASVLAGPCRARSAAAAGRSIIPEATGLPNAL